MTVLEFLVLLVILVLLLGILKVLEAIHFTEDIVYFTSVDSGRKTTQRRGHALRNRLDVAIDIREITIRLTDNTVLLLAVEDRLGAHLVVVRVVITGVAILAAVP